MTNFLCGHEWNQADLDKPARHALEKPLLFIMAVHPDGRPELVGSAFIVAAHGSYAVAISAAHNFYPGVHRIQDPHLRHHTTSLTEFLPNVHLVDLDQRLLRAVYVGGDQPEFCVLTELALDRGSDRAIFFVKPQGGTNKTLFDASVRITNLRPNIGDVVLSLGYADMATLNVRTDEEGNQTGQMQRRLVLRAGRVKAIYPGGHRLCQGPCIETTIPVFPGMSGGPAAMGAEAGSPLMVFGFVSSDLEVDQPNARNDRSRPGSSIIGLLPHETSAQRPGTLGFWGTWER